MRVVSSVACLLAVCRPGESWSSLIHPTRRTPCRCWRLLLTATTPDPNILEDSTGHVNRELAERIWNWEEERRQAKGLPKLSFSVRAGLRLVEEIADELTSNTKFERSVYNDLVQEGLSALLDVLSDHRIETSAEDFGQQARRRIRDRLASALEEDTRLVQLPQAVLEIVRRAKELKPNKTWMQVATAMKIPLEELLEYMRLYRSRAALSMESTVEINGPTTQAEYTDQDQWELRQGLVVDNGKTVRTDENVELDDMLEHEGDDEAWVQQEQTAGPLQDLIPDRDGLSPDDLVLNEMIRHDLREFLLDTLTEQEFKAVRLAYGLDGGRPRTMSATATALGLPVAQVSGLLNASLAKLRDSYKSRYVEPYLDDDFGEIADSV